MEKFFVGCDSESPERIYFSMVDAMHGAHAYIEVFDEDGIKVEAYKGVFADNGSLVYTTDF